MKTHCPVLLFLRTPTFKMGETATALLGQGRLLRTIGRRDDDFAATSRSQSRDLTLLVKSIGKLQVKFQTKLRSLSGPRRRCSALQAIAGCEEALLCQVPVAAPHFVGFGSTPPLPAAWWCSVRGNGQLAASHKASH